MTGISPVYNLFAYKIFRNISVIFIIDILNIIFVRICLRKYFRVDTSEEMETYDPQMCHCCRQLDSLDLLHSGTV